MELTGVRVQLIFDWILPKSRADVMYLSAPDNNIAAKTGVTLGGAEIEDDARWNGKWTPLPRSVTDGKLSIELPSASAALVKITEQ